MKSKLPYIIIGLLILFVWFYWFEIRPAQIRKKCYEWAIPGMGKGSEEELFAQESCWHRYGLK